MMTPKPRSFLLILALLGVVVGGVIAANTFSIFVTGSIDTPEKTVSIEGDSYQVSAIANIDRGDSITAQISAPDQTSYRVNLYGIRDGQQVIVDSAYVGESDPDSVTYDTAGYELGSYALAVYQDGQYKAVHPVIVSAADVSVTVENTVERGSSLNPTVKLSQLSNSTNIESVDIVLMNSSMSQRVKATQVDATTYETSIETETLGEDTYQLYAVVLNESKTPQGDHEPIGMSTHQAINVTPAQSTPTTTTDTPTTTQTSTTTTTIKTTTATPTLTTSTTTTTNRTSPTQSTTPPSTSSTEPTTPTPTATSTTTTESVITPNNPTTTNPTSTRTTVPGFHILSIITALLAGVGLRLRK